MGIRRRCWQWGQCSGEPLLQRPSDGRHGQARVPTFFNGFLPRRSRTLSFHGQEAVGEELRQAG